MNAFERFWAAGSVAEARDRIEGIVESGVTFEDAYDRLERGRSYDFARHRHRRTPVSGGAGGVEYYYHLNVPESYDPERRYQVRFQLHGGVGGRTTNEPRGSGEARIPGAEQIYVIPYSWNSVPWWGDAQVENLRSILDAVKPGLQRGRKPCRRFGRFRRWNRRLLHRHERNDTLRQPVAVERLHHGARQ